jgi:hypothetical protein
MLQSSSIQDGFFPLGLFIKTCFLILKKQSLHTFFLLKKQGDSSTSLKQFSHTNLSNLTFMFLQLPTSNKPFSFDLNIASLAHWAENFVYSKNISHFLLLAFGA